MAPNVECSSIGIENCWSFTDRSVTGWIWCPRDKPYWLKPNYKFDYTLVGVTTGVRTRSPDLGLKIYRTAAFKFAENAINSTARYPKPSRKFAVDISRLKKKWLHRNSRHWVPRLWLMHFSFGFRYTLSIRQSRLNERKNKTAWETIYGFYRFICESRAQSTLEPFLSLSAVRYASKWWTGAQRCYLFHLDLFIYSVLCWATIYSGFFFRVGNFSIPSQTGIRVYHTLSPCNKFSCATREKKMYWIVNFKCHG